MSAIQPYPHQQEIINRKANNIGLWLDTGAGKTFTALWCMENLNRDNVVIVCPKIVHGKWCIDTIALHGEPTELHMHKKERYVTLEYPNQVIHVMTKEYFRDKFDHRTAEARQLNGIIIDEGHYFAGIKSGMSKKLFSFISQFPPNNLSVYLLTATPYLSTPWNVYTLARNLRHDWNYGTFKKKMFFDMKMGGRYIPVERTNAHELLHPMLKQIGVFVSIEEVLEDMPPQTVRDEILKLSPIQHEAIKNMDATEHIVRFTRQHQIENGYIPGEILKGEQPKAIPCEKTDWVVQYVQKHPHTAIVCRYTYQINMLHKAITEQTALKPTILSGQTKKRDSVIEQARKNAQPIIIQAMVSEGYELPEIEHVVFASMDWGYKNYTQMMGRFLRMNAPTPTQFTRLISGNVDSRVLSAINRKQSFYTDHD